MNPTTYALFGSVVMLAVAFNAPIRARLHDWRYRRVVRARLLTLCPKAR